MNYKHAFRVFNKNRLGKFVGGGRKRCRGRRKTGVNDYSNATLRRCRVIYKGRVLVVSRAMGSPFEYIVFNKMKGITTRRGYTEELVI